ncbi:MAG: cytochrome c biogenesis protein CcsA, partial [Rhodothermales bacterium]|nr:cytochrome c biogenesis protein CcsA [Rhodothermales bacterium]
MLGTVGQLLILLAFVATGLAGFAFFRAARDAGRLTTDPVDWARIGRLAWIAMTAAAVLAWGILVYLIATHQFQYAYVYQQSSRDLPVYYLFSASWAGQEGSFLLWILLTAFVGLSLIKWADRDYRAPVMAVVAFCQFFLWSMIVGLQFGGLKIGASPFASLAEAFPEAPIFQANPDFVPADGTGLNDLLQNYWMVIHPPTLFVGFSTMIVPFAFAIAALWKRRYTEWVRPALPWTLFSVMILGVGIAMGGYWAYETLSFGGYWAWDPVENSSFVPWLIGVAAIHMMLIQKKSGHGHKAALFLNILAYMLVIYSTFLTRSGILGDISVHSFVDLGLYNQLLLWILAMGVLGFGLFAVRYRALPTPTKEPYWLSREMMIFAGAMLLCAIGAVVLLGTSAPIFGRVFRDNPASVPIAFYNKWSLPLTIGFVFLAGLGQVFWWNKMSVENVNRVLIKPMALAVASTLAVLVLTPFVELSVQPEVAAPVAQAAGLGGLSGFWGSYGAGLLLLLLLFVAFFAFYGNGLVLWRIARGNPKMAGGALAHVGLALTILGIISSGAFSDALTDAAPAEERENFVLERGEPRTVEGYRIEYTGAVPAERGRTRYVLHFTDPAGRDFTVRPVVYKSNKDQWIQHPEVKVF